MHTHRHHELVYVGKGRATQWMDERSSTLKTGDVVLLSSLVPRYTNGIRGQAALVDCVKIADTMFTDQSRSDVRAFRMLKYLGRFSLQTCGRLRLTRNTRQAVEVLMGRFMA